MLARVVQVHFAPGLSFDLLLAAWVDPTRTPEGPLEPASPHHSTTQQLEEEIGTQDAGAH